MAFIEKEQKVFRLLVEFECKNPIYNSGTTDAHPQRVVEGLDTGSEQRGWNFTPFSPFLWRRSCLVGGGSRLESHLFQRGCGGKVGELPVLVEAQGVGLLLLQTGTPVSPSPHWSRSGDCRLWRPTCCSPILFF